jgi:hypothetical protein
MMGPGLWLAAAMRAAFEWSDRGGAFDEAVGNRLDLTGVRAGVTRVFVESAYHSGVTPARIPKRRQAPVGGFADCKSCARPGNRGGGYGTPGAYHLRAEHRPHAVPDGPAHGDARV